MSFPRGIIPAMLTAYTADGDVDVDATKAFAEWLIGKGVHGLSPTGSTGEGAAMTDDERLVVIKATIEQAAGRVPVYAGIIHYSTKLAIKLATSAMDAGADGVMVLLPFYYGPTIPSAMDHLRAVSHAIGQPIMVYNNPWFAGFELSPEQVRTLVDEGVVNSIKAAHGDPMRVNYLKYLCGDKITALYGHDYAPLEAFAAGGDGWLSGFPNVVPDLAVELFDAVHNKADLTLAQSIWARIAPLGYYFMYERTGPNAAPHWLTVFKEMLRLLGEDIGMPRLPAVEMTPDERAVLRKYVAMVYPEQVAAD
ncbi:dihydrodipicolinate synthase family protein [Aggregatilinea lenta]|uniref:dihydrodipicolinate synthase family protein n=1 Tax=Aggregatilinea lenta TaxID=913108 RepID=UPI000E5A8330|nr:dihydrodipicolinate synthase family protein [Aggregatilinea lenta]